jgi:hypothetical protein
VGVGGLCMGDCAEGVCVHDGLMTAGWVGLAAAQDALIGASKLLLQWLARHSTAWPQKVMAQHSRAQQGTCPSRAAVLLPLPLTSSCASP